MRWPRALFGLLVLALFLGQMASVWALQPLVLGALLDLQGRRARGAALSAGLPLLEGAARLGAVLLCLWLGLLPARALSSLAESAALVNPAGAGRWLLQGSSVIAAVLAVAHATGALAQGAGAGACLHPLSAWRFLRRAPALMSTWTSRATPLLAQGAALVVHLGRLGLLGLAAAALWLLLPAALLAAPEAPEGAAFLLALLGGLLFAGGCLYLPALMSALAARGELAGALDLRGARAAWRRAPCAWLGVTALFALLSTLALAARAIPAPSELAPIAWALFVLGVLVVKLAAAAAYARAARATREAPRWLTLPSGALALLLVTAHVLLLALSPTVAVEGKRVLFSYPVL